MEVRQLSSSLRTIASAEEEGQYSSGMLFGKFEHDWYIRVKVQDANIAMKIELIESNVLALLKGTFFNL